jgi:hypothetical protein
MSSSPGSRTNVLPHLGAQSAPPVTKPFRHRPIWITILVRSLASLQYVNPMLKPGVTWLFDNTQAKPSFTQRLKQRTAKVEAATSSPPKIPKIELTPPHHPLPSTSLMVTSQERFGYCLTDIQAAGRVGPAHTAFLHYLTKLIHLMNQLSDKGVEDRNTVFRSGPFMKSGAGQQLTQRPYINCIVSMDITPLRGYVDLGLGLPTCTFKVMWAGYYPRFADVELSIDDLINCAHHLTPFFRKYVFTHIIFAHAHYYYIRSTDLHFDRISFYIHSLFFVFHLFTASTGQMAISFCMDETLYACLTTLLRWSSSTCLIATLKRKEDVVNSVR